MMTRCAGREGDDLQQNKNGIDCIGGLWTLPQFNCYLKKTSARGVAIGSGAAYRKKGILRVRAHLAPLLGDSGENTLGIWDEYATEIWSTISERMACQIDISRHKSATGLFNWCLQFHQALIFLQIGAHQWRQTTEINMYTREIQRHTLLKLN